jgi:hypothetical protein
MNLNIKSLLVTAVLATALLCLSPAGAMAAGLTQAQISAIMSLLQSFGADATAVANVQTSLNGGTPSIQPSIPPSFECRVDIDCPSVCSQGSSSGSCVTYKCVSNKCVADNQPFITVTSPNGGETWTVGSTHDITWNSNGLPANAHVSIGINGDGQTSTLAGGYITQALASAGKYSWTIPTTLGGVNLANKKFMVYVTFASITTVINPIQIGDTSNNSFTITASNSTLPTATISVSPQTVSAGQCATLTWSSTNATAASITGPTFGTPTNNNGPVAVNGSKTICPTATTNYFTLFVSGPNGYAQAKTTLNVGAITNPPVPVPLITVTSPNGGETWKVGETHNITWTAEGVNNVMIELNKGNPNTGWHLTYSVPASHGSFNWILPTNLVSGSDYFIKIWDTTNVAVVGSSNIFSITPASNSCGISTSADFCQKCYANGGIVKPGEAGCWCASKNAYINAWYGSCPTLPTASLLDSQIQSIIGLLQSFGVTSVASIMAALQGLK